MPTKKPGNNLVTAAEQATRDYLQAVDRMIAIAEKLGDSHSKLTLLKNERDNRLLSAVTAWHSLDSRDRDRISHLLVIVKQPAVENLLRSIREQSATTRPPLTSSKRSEDQSSL